MAEAVIMAAALATSAYSAYQQNQNSTQANDIASKTAKDQEDAQKKADDQLAKSQGQNSAKQTQDAQWMALKTIQNTQMNSEGSAPYSLSNQSGAAGAAAGSQAGKLK